MVWGTEDQIVLFAERGRRKAKIGCRVYVIFIAFAFTFMYLLSGGNLEEYRTFFLGFGILTAVTLLFSFIAYLGCSHNLKKEKEQFSNEELMRINREAAKGPRLEHIMITQDVIGYHIGIRTFLIPVRDIVWIRQREKTHVHHIGEKFLPMGERVSFVDIRTRDGAIHHISSNLRTELEQEVYNYLAFTIKMRRPGVLIGSEEKWNHVSKEEFQAIVKQVDGIGTRDASNVEMVYNMERLYGLCRSGIGDSRNTEVKLIAAVAVSYLVAFFLFHYSDSIVRFDNLLKQDLFTRMFQTFFAGIFVLLPPVFVIGSFFKNVLFDKERNPSLLRLVVYFMFGFLTVSYFLIFVMMTKQDVQGVGAFQDWCAYANGRMETYEGILLQTDSPAEDGINIVKEEKYQYAEVGDTYFAYYTDCLVEPNLMQSDYRVSYTPHLRIMVSMTDNYDNERVALQHSDMEKLQESFRQSIEAEKEKYVDQNTWQGGDMVFAKQEQIYGYDELNEDEQMDFDLLYSEIYFAETERIREFQLPRKLSKESFQKIMDLYESNHRYDSFFCYNYKTGDPDEVYKAYAAKNEFGVKEYNTYSERYQKKAEQIAEQIPENLDTEGKVQWITDYLLEHVEAYSTWKEAENTEDLLDDSNPQYEKRIQSGTGYGALIYGVADPQGFMEAFGMICQKAGIYTIAAIDADISKYWNLVEINGTWLAVNVGDMAKDRENPDMYYLVPNSEMEKQIEAKATYGLSEWFDLPE